MIKSSKLCDLHIPNQSVVVEEERAGIFLQSVHYQVQNFNFSLRGSNSTATSISPGKLSSLQNKMLESDLCSCDWAPSASKPGRCCTDCARSWSMVLPSSQIIPRNCVRHHQIAWGRNVARSHSKNWTVEVIKDLDLCTAWFIGLDGECCAAIALGLPQGRVFL